MNNNEDYTVIKESVIDLFKAYMPALDMELVTRANLGNTAFKGILKRPTNIKLFVFACQRWMFAEENGFSFLVNLGSGPDQILGIHPLKQGRETLEFQLADISYLDLSERTQFLRYLSLNYKLNHSPIYSLNQ